MFERTICATTPLFKFLSSSRIDKKLLLIILLLMTIKSAVCESDKSDENEYVLKQYINEENCSGKCLRKCCSSGYVLQAGRNCSLSSENETLRDDLGKTIAHDAFKEGLMECPNGKYLVSNGSEQFYIQSDFSLWIEEYKEYVPQGSFCVDYDDQTIAIAIVCFPEEKVMRQINSIGMMVSLPFLFVTLVVYIITWENTIQKNCQMAYVFSLMSAYFYLVYIQQNSTLENTPCIVLASFCLYFFMASFCWMNILCIDMYCTFSGMRGYNTFKRSSQWKRFTMYLIYAFGAPSILLGLIFVLNKSENLKAWYHPLFGEGQCWLGHGYPVLLYFNGPMGALLFANIVLFVLTAWKIYQINRDTKMLRSRESQKHYDSNKQQFKVYVKLLLAMGINWILEFISWLVDWILGSKRVPEVWIVTDFCNALYGVFIFLLFVCKKPVWIKIKQRYYTWMGKPNTARALSARTSTPNQTSMTYETTMA